MTVSTQRLKENLGGIVSLLTIDATGLTNNPTHIRRYTNNYGAGGLGVIYQGNTFSPYPYQLPTVTKSSKSNRQNSKVNIGDLSNVQFTRFIEEVGSLEGAKIIEIYVYERFLDGNIEANPNAFSVRLNHTIDFIEDSNDLTTKIVNTVDPLSRSIIVPSRSFTAGEPNSSIYSPTVFPAISRNIARG
tara:strand:+ start:8517 stop:9080 length:564 start_codon:yes stop_codon:yes gene_type:complete